MALYLLQGVQYHTHHNFAQAIMFIPMTLAGFQGGDSAFMRAFTGR